MPESKLLHNKDVFDRRGEFIAKLFCNPSPSQSPNLEKSGQLNDFRWETNVYKWKIRISKLPNALKISPFRHLLFDVTTQFGAYRLQ